MTDFDPRNWNLFNIIRYGSWQINFVIYFGSALILYLWVYIERTKRQTRESADLKIKIAQFEDVAMTTSQSSRRPSTETIDKLTIKTGSKVTIIPVDQVVFFQANGPYVNIVTGTSTQLLNTAMYELEASLPPQFLRVHRSYIVNLEFISQVKSLQNGDYQLMLKTGVTIKASRTYREQLRKAIGKL